MEVVCGEDLGGVVAVALLDVTVVVSFSINGSVTTPGLSPWLHEEGHSLYVSNI